MDTPTSVAAGRPYRVATRGWDRKSLLLDRDVVIAVETIRPTTAAKCHKNAAYSAPLSAPRVEGGAFSGFTRARTFDDYPAGELVEVVTPPGRRTPVLPGRLHPLGATRLFRSRTPWRRVRQTAASPARFSRR